ncbi:MULTISPECIES: hypothetical protein [Pseudomonas aeruginosa group]|uniref:hypothetical protein n=1 Tax=Pseudomonas aeruginosa group TaxID=136841 RepID=UPI001F2A575F|nr:MULTISPECIES: hypothetical protein [Pseudomonas aeruginosa group]
MAKANPFIPPGKDYGAVDTESRLRALEEFNLEQCHAALEVLGLQATVEKKLRIRIRALEKLASTSVCADSAESSLAPVLERPEVIGYACLDDIQWGGDITLRPEKSEHYSVPFVPATQAGHVSEPCNHVFTDDGMFTVHCSKCDLEIKAEPSDEVMDHARQLASQAGGVDDGSYLLTGDDLDQIVSEACAMAVIEYAATPQPAKGE